MKNLKKNNSIKIKAFAKINLMLDINYRRNDGYHDLFMIMQSVDVYDTVTVSKCSEKGIHITCNIDDIPCDEKNIAYKAAQQFFKDAKVRNYGVLIDIEKRIPHAAGLAGGSADGAAVIVALNELYSKNLSQKELCAIGVKIGADVPFCIVGGTKLSQGIGEILNKVKPLSNCYIVLAKPEVGVNTAFAYKQYDLFGTIHRPRKLEMLCAIQNKDLTNVCSLMENVFEQFIEVPQRVSIKRIMRNNNALGVCMSGSGPTTFGIFQSKEDAEKCKEELKGLAKDIVLCKPARCGCKIMNK